MIRRAVNSAIQALLFVVLALACIPKQAVNAQQNLIFGQEHAYSVYLKSNHEAFVFARLSLTNPDEAQLKSSSFELSNAKASEMSLYQVLLPRECAEYDYGRNTTRNCLRYKDPSYTNAYGYYGGGYGNNEETEYHKISYQESAGKYTFDLPKPIDSYKSGAIVAIYATKDYVKSSLGRFAFSFETLKVDQRVIKSDVAVTVETNYDLKNPDKTPSYGYYGLAEDATLSAGSAEASFTNPDVDKLVYSIGGRGQLNKTFDSVTPGESVKVEGLFAKGTFKLYMFEIMLTILGVGGFMALIIVLSKKYGKRLGGSAKQTAATQSVPASFTLLNPFHWIVSLVSVLMVGGLTLAINALTKSANGVIDDGGPVVGVFLAIIVLFVFLAVTLGPIIFVAKTHKWKAAVTVIGMELVWYTIAALLIVQLT